MSARGLFIRLYGCYEALDGGRVHDALLDMTGGVTELVDLRGSVSPDKIADLLMACEGMETIMGAGIFVSLTAVRSFCLPVCLSVCLLV